MIKIYNRYVTQGINPVQNLSISSLLSLFFFCSFTPSLHFRFPLFLSFCHEGFPLKTTGEAGDWGSAVSSPNGDLGGVPSKIEFVAF